VYVPYEGSAEAEIFRVEVAIPFGGGLTGEGVKVPEVPAGRPLKDKDTSELNPLCEVTVTVNVVDPPRITVLWDGWIEIVKYGSVEGVTVIEAFAQRVSEPLIPHTLNVKLPGSVSRLVKIVSVEWFPSLVGVTGLMLKVGLQS